MGLRKGLAAIMAVALLANSAPVMAEDVVFGDEQISGNISDEAVFVDDWDSGADADAEEEFSFDDGETEEETLFGTGEAEVTFQDDTEEDSETSDAEELYEGEPEESNPDTGLLLGASGVSYNKSGYTYWGWPTSALYSYLTAEDDGYLRVEYCSNQILVEYYDLSYQLQSQKTIENELSYFGGFYAGTDAYYLLFGERNSDASNSAEVMRVVKYDKNWNRIGSASLYGANTKTPFSNGRPRMVEYGGYLYIHTSHFMYNGHQANMTVQVNTSGMYVTDSSYEVGGNGYVSHSYDQFILVDDQANLVTMDMGDSYPRGDMLGIFSKKAGTSSFTGSGNTYSVFSFYGSGMTSSSLGGFEYSSSCYLTAGHSVPQDENRASYIVRNVFVSATSRYSKSTTVKWITNYSEDEGINAGTPQLVKLGSDSFLLLWEQLSKYSTTGKICYVFLDGQGNTVSPIYTQDGYLSDCQPIASGGAAVWYVTDGENLTFYKVSADGTLETEVGHVHSYKPQMKFASSTVSCGLIEETVENPLTTDSDGKVTYSSSDTSIAAVDENGIVTLKKVGTCKITATVAGTADYVKKSLSYTLKVLSLKKQTITVTDSYAKTYGDKKFSLDAVSSSGASLSYASDNESVAAVSDTGEVTIVGSGTATITITAARTSKYLAATAKTTVTVEKKSIEDCQMIFTVIGAIPYDSQSDYSEYLAVADGGKLLTAGTDFIMQDRGSLTHQYYLACIWKYIYGSGNYQGWVCKQISPIREKPVLSKAVRNTSNVTLTWEQETGAIGYVIYRKTDDGSYKKVKTISNNSTVSWKDTAAANEKSVYKYYIKSYTKNSEGTIYSKASNVKTVKALETPSMKFAQTTLNCGLIQESVTNKLTTNTDGKITYTSSDTSVATVSSSGKVTLKKIGKCTITASAARSQKYSAKKVSYTLNVLSLKQQTIKVTGSFTKTYGDKNFSLGASCSGGAKLSYSSSNKKVVTVSDTGEVTVVGSGTASITVTAAATSKYIKTSTKVTVTVKAKSIEKCKLIFTKTGSIPANDEKYEDYLMVLDGDTVLTEGKDYTLRMEVLNYTTYADEMTLDLLKEWVTGTGNYQGEFSKTIKPITEKPVLSSAVRSKSGVTLTWEEESGALGYVIYRKADDGSYALAATIKNSSTVSWKDTTAVNTKSVYKYYIKAYTRNKQGKVYSKISNVKTVNALKTPSMKFARTTVKCGLIQGSVTNSLTTDTDGKITYTSSDTSIATVSSAGKVTLKKVGKCTITASAAMTQKYESKKVTYTLNVLSLKQQTIKVSESFTKTYGGKNFSLDASCSGGAELSYTSSNKKVVTVSDQGEVTIVGAGTASITIKSAITDEYIAASTKVTVKINRKSVSGCRIYFTKIGSVGAESSEFEKYIQVAIGDTILTRGTDYTIWESSYASRYDELLEVDFYITGIGNYTGELGQVINPITRTSVLNSAKLTSQGIQLSWQKEAGALGYEIYRKQGSGSYSLVKTITSRNTVKWTDTSVTSPSAVYMYYVRAYTKNGSKTIYAAKSEAKTILPVLDKPVISKIVKSGTGLKLTIKKVTGATGYVIQRYNGTKWVKVATTSSLTYTDTAASKTGTTYKYRVRACCTANGKTGYSEYSDTKSAKR